MAVAFARVLREAGLAVPLDSVLTFVAALGALDVGRRDDVYHAGRATLVRRFEDLAIYDRAFAAFWHGMSSADDEPAPTRHVTLLVDADDESDHRDESDDGTDGESLHLRFSARETLRHKDFAAYDEDELREATVLMRTFRLAGTPRRSARLDRNRSRGEVRDIAATVRSALAHGGEPVRLRWRQRTDRLRRLVVLLDVSGSMEPYARALLRFVHATVVGRQRVEAFTFGTRLTRVTREMRSRDPDRALRQAAARVSDWSGGTRLGESLRRFNDEWGQRGMARGAIVIVLSDGWDRGDPETLSAEMARLARVAHRIVWVNPLKVTPGYAPLARGMAAALPHVDDFVEGHSIAALERLARVVSRG